MLLDRDPVEAAKAEVDDASAPAPRGEEAVDLVADGQLGIRACIPELELGLRVDADDAEAVLGRGRDRGGGGAVQLLVVPVEAHRVQRDRVRPGGELLVFQVDAGIDHRQRYPRPGRREAVGADVRDPPLRRRQRVGELAEEPGFAARLGSDGHIRRHRADKAAAKKPREKALRRPARQAPELERRRDQLAAGLAQAAGDGRPPHAVELDERARVRLEPLQRLPGRRRRTDPGRVGMDERRGESLCAPCEEQHRSQRQ